MFINVIAVRITAENASDGWKPTVGQIHEIDLQSLPGVWGYFSVRVPNAEVHAYADSQFGHVFAHAPTRTQAAYLLQLALKNLRVVGEIHSNIPYASRAHSQHIPQAHSPSTQPSRAAHLSRSIIPSI